MGSEASAEDGAVRIFFGRSLLPFGVASRQISLSFLYPWLVSVPTRRWCRDAKSLKELVDAYSAFRMG